MESLKSDLRTWIDSHRDKENMYQNVNLILGLLKEMSQILLVKKNKEMEQKQNLVKKTDIDKCLNEFHENIESVKKDKADADDVLDELLANFNSDVTSNPSVVTVISVSLIFFISIL